MTDPVVFFAWQSPGDEPCVRTRSWWTIVVIAGIGLFAYSLLTANFAFAVMLVMFGIIMMMARKNHGPVDVVIADQAVLVGNDVYPYGDLKEYLLIDEAGLIYFFMKGMLASHVHVRFPDDIDPQELRMVLKGRVAENPNRTAEPLIDALAKRLKIF